MGTPPAQIATALNCTVSVVQDLIRNDADIARRRDACAARMQSKITQTKFEMAEYLYSAAVMTSGSMKAKYLRAAAAIAR